MSFLSKPSLPPIPPVPQLPPIPKVATPPSRTDSERIQKQDERLRKRLTGGGRARTILGGSTEEGTVRKTTLLGGDV